MKQTFMWNQYERYKSADDRTFMSDVQESAVKEDGGLGIGSACVGHGDSTGVFHDGRTHMSGRSRAQGDVRIIYLESPSREMKQQTNHTKNRL